VCAPNHFFWKGKDVSYLLFDAWCFLSMITDKNFGIISAEFGRKKTILKMSTNFAVECMQNPLFVPLRHLFPLLAGEARYREHQQINASMNCTQKHQRIPSSHPSTTIHQSSLSTLKMSQELDDLAVQIEAEITKRSGPSAKEEFEKMKEEGTKSQPKKGDMRPNCFANSSNWWSTSAYPRLLRSR
jgi:hypothetical protein